MFVRLFHTASMTAALLVSVALAATLKPQTTTQMSGRVADAVSLQPLRNARVSLEPSGRSTVTDSEGQFMFTGLASGSYLLNASAVGYSNARPEWRKVPGNSGIPLSLAPGGSIERTVLMHPAAEISGRLYGNQGRPAPSIIVTPFRLSYDELGTQSAVPLAASTTDDRGEFRFSQMDPGSYGLRFRLKTLDLTGPSGGIFQPFYYPTVTEISNATMVRVDSSEKLRVDNVTIPTRPMGKLRISLLDELGHPILATASIRIYFERDSVTLREGNKPAGVSEILTGELPYGRYDIEVSAFVTGEPGRTGQISVDLSSPEMAATVDVRSYARWTGRVVNGDESAVPNVDIGMIEPSAFARRGNNGISRVRSGADGRFVSLPLRSHAQLFVRILQLPDDAYPVRIDYQGQDVLRSGLPIGVAENIQFDIVLSRNAGTIRGEVGSKFAADAAGGIVSITPLNLKDKHKSLSARIAVDGTFRIASIEPGEYLLYAWAELNGAAWRNAEFMASYDGKGRPIRVMPGEELELSVDFLDR